GLPLDAPASVTHLGVRPEHIALTAPDRGHVSGTVRIAEYLGADIFAHIDCGTAGTLVVRAPGTTPVREDETVGLTFDPAALHLFDKDGLALTV
ncbi:MAG: TOBE domain-containing protein, partial [Pseudomonadota bacterium]